MKITQCKLVFDNRETIAYIDAEFAKKGWLIRMDGVDGLWYIQEVYKDSTTEYHNVHRNWKVGGL
jgi:hypothetical protein